MINKDLREQVIGEIMNVMEKERLTKSDVARHAEMHVQNLWRMLSGSQNMRLDTLAKIAKGLNYKISLKLEKI